MSQRIDSIYRLVTVPKVYSAIQLLLGADRSRRRYVEEVLSPRRGMRFLDVGCGPATILPYLPEVDYTGIDLNARHIEHARATYGTRGRFLVGDVSRSLGIEDAGFDLINVSGLLHHIDDAAAAALLRDCLALLRPGGRLVTIDPLRMERQRVIAKLLIALDSGLRIRSARAYRQLTDGLDADIEVREFHDALRVPYDHFLMILRRRSAA